MRAPTSAPRRKTEGPTKACSYPLLNEFSQPAHQAPSQRRVKGSVQASSAVRAIRPARMFAPSPPRARVRRPVARTWSSRGPSSQPGASAAAPNLSRALMASCGGSASRGPRPRSPGRCTGGCRWHRSQDQVTEAGQDDWGHRRGWLHDFSAKNQGLEGQRKASFDSAAFGAGLRSKPMAAAMVAAMADWSTGLFDGAFADAGAEDHRPGLMRRTGVEVVLEGHLGQGLASRPQSGVITKIVLSR